MAGMTDERETRFAGTLGPFGKLLFNRRTALVRACCIPCKWSILTAGRDEARAAYRSHETRGSHQDRAGARTRESNLATRLEVALSRASFGSRSA